jgi:hypothetical protein
VINTLHVVVKPLNEDCMVLAWISQSMDIVIVRAEAVPLFSNVIRLYFQQHFCKTLYSYLQANTRTWVGDECRMIGGR